MAFTVTPAFLQSVGSSMQITMRQDGAWNASIGAASGTGPDEATAVSAMLSQLLGQLQVQAPALTTQAQNATAAAAQLQAGGVVVPPKGP